MDLVKDRPEPEPIEIELTSNIEDHDVDDLIVTSSTDGAPSAAARDQRRVFAVATVVGVLALLLGWLIGRSTGADEVATSPITTPATIEAVAETLMPGETLPSPSTTRPRRTTTTTTLAPPTIETIEIDPRLEGVELRLVGSEQSRVLVELDLAEHTLTRQNTGRSFESQAMIVGQDWIALMSQGGGTTTLIRDGEGSQRLDLGEPWQLLWQEGTDLFWRPDLEHESFNGPSLYEQVDIAGEPTGVTLELPVDAWVQRTDPLGGLIVEVTGKSYSIGESGVSLIGNGQLIALSADIAVLRDCDELLRCGLFVIDRQTGAVRALELDSELTPIESISSWGPPGQGRAISPDGTMVAVMLPSTTGPLLGLVDLWSGAVVELGAPWWSPTVVWSPDGRFAFFLDGEPEFGGPGMRRLSAYDRESGEVFPVVAEPLVWDSLAARPTGS